MNRSLLLPEALYRPLCAALFVMAAAVHGAHADPAAGLGKVEKQLDEARDQERTLDRRAAEAEAGLAALRQRSVAIAARAREHEASIGELEERLDGLEARRQQTAISLDARRDQLGGMLAALQRIAMHPPAALIALPTEPVDTIRSALLLRGTVPVLASQARALRDDLDALAELTQAVMAARQRLGTERAALDEQRVELARLTDERAALARETRHAQRAAAERAERLGREASDLRDLLARLATQRSPAGTAVRPSLPPAPPPRVSREPVEPRVASLRPPVPRALPVIGRIERTFGAPDESGRPARGLTIAAGPGSTVVAPRDGTVVFAGPFRGLGQLLIIEHQGKYHLLLAGLARIDSAVGESVLAGEPVGTMQASGDAGIALYMELRLDGEPINPLPWLAAGRTRVNG